MDTSKTIKKNIQDAVNIKLAILHDESILEAVDASSHAIVQSFQANGKVLFCGNGGSAADAQHLAAELSGRYYLDRPALFAEALHVNSSYMTAVANDFSFDDVYSRFISAIGKQGDVLVAMSTSGKSKNIINAAQTAKGNQMTVIGMTGKEPSPLDEYCDILIKIPSTDTPRIQEAHLIIGHTICEVVEATIFG